MSKALPGEHLCEKHQGNGSHYAEENCRICKLQRACSMMNDEVSQILGRALKYREDASGVLVGEHTATSLASEAAIHIKALTEVYNEASAELRHSTQWKRVTAEPPPENEPLLVYAPEWVCPDFNTKGIREGILVDGEWITTFWTGCHEYYDTDYQSVPTHWIGQPNPPHSAA